MSQEQTRQDGSKGSPRYYFANEARDWAIERWQSEVAHRPLQNIHRRTLDDTWRQVIRHFGGDDELICGPRHDELVDIAAEAGNN